MGLTVSKAEPADVPAIVELLDELDRFYGAATPSSAGARSAQVRNLLFDDPAGINVVLARQGDDPVGLASYAFLWPAAGVTRSLYLKELYVRAAFRRRGVGSMLMQHLRDIAVESGCSRVEWTADDDNPQALRFYEQLGYCPRGGKVFFRLELDGDPDSSV